MLALRPPHSTAALRAFALVAPLALTACASYLDARAEGALRDALVRVVGPAESYEVRVSGASLDGSRFERVRFVGRRIARAGAPVVDRLELDLQGVVVDRREKALTAVAATHAELRLRGVDLAAYLRGSGWIADPSVVFSAPDRIAIAGTPRLAGIALAIGDGAEFAGPPVRVGIAAAPRRRPRPDRLVECRAARCAPSSSARSIRYSTCRRIRCRRRSTPSMPASTACASSARAAACRRRRRSAGVVRYSAATTIICTRSMPL